MDLPIKLQDAKQLAIKTNNQDLLESLTDSEIRKAIFDGYMVTQYCNFSVATENEYLKYLQDEKLTEILEAENISSLIDMYNQYCNSNYFYEDCYYSLDTQTLNDVLRINDPLEAFKLGLNSSDFNFNDDYFNYFDKMYLISYTKEKVKQNILKDDDFKEWIIKNYDCNENCNYKMVQYLDEDYQEMVLLICNEFLRQGY